LANQCHIITVDHFSSAECNDVNKTSPLQMLWMNILIFSVSFLAILVAVTRAHLDYKNCEDEMEEKWRTLASVVVAEALEVLHPVLVWRFVQSLHQHREAPFTHQFLLTTEAASCCHTEIGEIVDIAEARWVSDRYTVQPPKSDTMKRTILTEAQQNVQGRFVSCLWDLLPMFTVACSRSSENTPFAVNHLCTNY
jgi:hypothetical protein